ncbi:hypothetical protein TNCV_2048901 [Trichonephila clavipes]|nr:hypothetical protein TNCV_2048901 [Trichonephila clavipes]
MSSSSSATKDSPCRAVNSRFSVVTQNPLVGVVVWTEDQAIQFEAEIARWLNVCRNGVYRLWNQFEKQYLEDQLRGSQELSSPVPFHDTPRAKKGRSEGVGFTVPSPYK